MSHLIADVDRVFKGLIETRGFPLSEFDHRAHLRLAYIYLVQTGNVDDSVELMRDALLGLMKQAGIEPSEKYHETLTEAWVLAIHHFMNRTEPSSSANDFINQNPALLESEIMLTHSSAALWYSAGAHRSFVKQKPDLSPQQRH